MLLMLEPVKRNGDTEQILGFIHPRQFQTALVYVGSNDGYMYAFDAETGDVKWESQISNEVFPSPTVTDGIIYAGSDIFLTFRRSSSIFA